MGVCKPPVIVSPLFDTLATAKSYAAFTADDVAALVVLVLFVDVLNWTIPGVVVLADVRRSFGTVPEAIFVPFNDVNPLPSPTNEDAVRDPDIVSPVILTKRASLSDSV